SYKLDDDYGVSQAQATFGLTGDQATDGVEPHPLYKAPDFALSLPQGRTRHGVGEMIKDLTEHPWAGATVSMTLVARDDAGNEGKSEPYDLQLPQRPFYKPLAKALIEQRRDLALDANHRDRVLIALDILATAPDRFGVDAGTFLGLRTLFWALSR